jgi:energy-converting hydrogenase Eha subunit F
MVAHIRDVEWLALHPRVLHRVASRVSAMMVKFEYRMGSIFLSYRREDAEGQAGRLYHDLVAVFGSDSVFMDVAAIQPGRDFLRAIDQSLNSCGVFLCLIGKNWLTTTDASGRRRLDDPADFVRIETVAALKRDIPVIPVQVQGATALRPEQLPDDLKDLAYRNAMELTHPRWESDVQLLVNAVRPYVSRPHAGPEPEVIQHGKTSTRVKYFSLAVVVLFGLGVVFYLWPGKKVVGPPAQKSTETATSPAATDSVAPETTKRTPEEVASQQPNAAPPELSRVEDFSLAAEQEPLADNPKRYTFTLSLKAPSGMIGEISRVHYQLVYDPNPLSLEGGPAPRFSAVYEGWGCYETVVVTVYFQSGASKPLTKTFNMCKALNR